MIHAVQDALLALAVAALGVAEIWVPFESVNGQGSPVVSTVGVVIAAGLLTQRRARPVLSVGVFAVWLVIGVTTLGEMQVLFFGQMVPFMLALYSLARHGSRRLAWTGAASAAVTLLFGDLFIPALQAPPEIIFHWTVCALAFAIGWGLRASEHRAVAAALRASQVEAASRELTAAAITDERARIARELHDVLAHSVSVMVVQAGAAAQAVDDDPAFVRRALESIRATGAESLDEVRRVVNMLRDSGEEAGLVPQPGVGGLDDLVAAARATGLQVTSEVTGDADRLPAGLSLAVFRIVQESLTNVRKHARADAVQVSVNCEPHQVEVRVVDDGAAQASSPGSPGHGLIGMRERAALYGGTLEAARVADGFAVRAVLPRIAS
ncbi:histidine kinase [Agromyces humatus]|uniref:histidine kinase n=1 Tax=Agromyces humatus TaxID=279573 RepID=A0ABN2KVQ0_9MICO